MKCCTFQFRGRHHHFRGLTSSDEVGTSAARSGSPENMVVAILFATLAHLHIKFQVVPVSGSTSPSAVVADGPAGGVTRGAIMSWVGRRGAPPVVRRAGGGRHPCHMIDRGRKRVLKTGLGLGVHRCQHCKYYRAKLAPVPLGRAAPKTWS